MGMSHGKGRLKLILDMPKVGVRALLPTIEAPLTFAAAGDPEVLLMFGLPNAGDWQQAEAFLKTTIPDMDEHLQPFKDRVLATTGLRFDDWLNLFGPELAYVADAAGQYNVLAPARSGHVHQVAGGAATIRPASAMSRASAMGRRMPT